MHFAMHTSLHPAIPSIILLSGLPEQIVCVDLNPGHCERAVLGWVQGSPMTFPSSLRRRTRDLGLVPVVSAPVEVDPSCRYAHLPLFSHFGDSISFVGGINKPKLIQCFDSAGHCHRQLVSPLSPCHSSPHH